MESSRERRIFQRIEGDFSGWYGLKDHKEILGEFIGLDFSAGGIRVHTNKQMLEGRTLDLNLVSPVVTSPIRETAQIVWQRENETGIWEAGLKFYNPDLIRLWPLISPKEYYSV
jgi:hypothetical protein